MTTNIPTRAIVLCAGLGTRLGSLTERTPKPLIKVAGVLVIRMILHLLISHGVHQFCINLHHLPLQIMDEVNKTGDGVFYSPEPELMGTAGAFKKVSNWLTDPFVVMNGDTITNVDLTNMVKFHKMGESIATVYTKDDLIHSGGVYVFSKEVLKYIPERKPYSIHLDLIPKLIKKKETVSEYQDFNSHYFDIGTPHGLRKARKYFKDEESCSMPIV